MYLSSVFYSKAKRSPNQTYFNVCLLLLQRFSWIFRSSLLRARYHDVVHLSGMGPRVDIIPAVQNFRTISARICPSGLRYRLWHTALYCVIGRLSGC